MPYTITYNTPMASKSTSRPSAALALEAALDLQATGHSTVRIVDPAGAAWTIDELAEHVREAIGGE